MKILMAVHHLPPTFGGGAEWRAQRTARELQQAGHQVQIVCVESITHGEGQKLQHTTTDQDGVTVHRLYFDLARSPDPFLWSYRNPLVGQHVRGLLRAFGPQILHLISGYLMSGSTIEAAQQVGVPVVLSLTDFWFLCPRITLLRSDGSLCTTPADPLACALCLRKEKRRYRLPDQMSGGIAGRLLSRIWQRNDDALVAAIRERKAYLLSLLNTVDAVISPSRFLKDMIEAQGGAPRHAVHMRQGLDLHGWADAGPAPGNDRLRIGYIGQIARHKGVDILVEAFCSLRPAERRPRLELFGDADQFPRFADRLRRRVAGRDDVLFAGRFDHSQIRRIHAGIDVLVVPSRWYENSPNVILEAFATGTPVVVSALGGMAELVTDGVNGFHFEAGNVKALARVLQRFVDQPDLAARLGRATPPVKTVQKEIEELLLLYRALEAG
jgi:glycosyltransferase involved in cell wall biosynthesis